MLCLCKKHRWLSTGPPKTQNDPSSRGMSGDNRGGPGEARPAPTEPPRHWGAPSSHRPSFVVSGRRRTRDQPMGMGSTQRGGAWGRASPLRSPHVAPRRSRLRCGVVAVGKPWRLSRCEAPSAEPGCAPHAVVAEGLGENREYFPLASLFIVPESRCIPLRISVGLSNGAQGGRRRTAVRSVGRSTAVGQAVLPLPSSCAGALSPHCPPPTLTPAAATGRARAPYLQPGAAVLAGSARRSHAASRLRASGGSGLRGERAAATWLRGSPAAPAL